MVPFSIDKNSHRNGYEPGRLRTAEGEITVTLPQVREWAEEGPHRSQLTGLLRGNSDFLEKLAVEMCAVPNRIAPAPSTGKTNPTRSKSDLNRI